MPAKRSVRHLRWEQHPSLVSSPTDLTVSWISVSLFSLMACYVEALESLLSLSEDTSRAFPLVSRLVYAIENSYTEHCRRHQHIRYGPLDIYLSWSRAHLQPSHALRCFCHIPERLLSTPSTIFYTQHHIKQEEYNISTFSTNQETIPEGMEDNVSTYVCEFEEWPIKNIKQEE